jgi:hypothetical protein
MGGIGVLVVIWLAFGLVAGMIGAGRKIGLGGGFFFGVLLGPLGVLIAAMSPGPSVLDRVEARPSEAGWHPDPLGRFDSRWYDGKAWTQHVGRVAPDGSRGQFEDPL